MLATCRVVGFETLVLYSSKLWSLRYLRYLECLKYIRPLTSSLSISYLKNRDTKRESFQWVKIP